MDGSGGFSAALGFPLLMQRLPVDALQLFLARPARLAPLPAKLPPHAATVAGGSDGTTGFSTDRLKP
jgi:hypothetical protein